MTRDEFDVFLLGGMILCGMMALVSLARARAKGASAWFQAAGFFAMGVALWLLRRRVGSGFIIAAFVVVGLALIADFVYRSARDVGSKPD